VRIVPAAWLFGWAGRPLQRIRRFAISEVDWVTWAVDTAAARGATHLARVLAVQVMLRRRGIAARLCLGIARKDGQLTSYAWIERGGRVVAGAAEAARSKRVAIFGEA
jgi:Transglutaminase-like superfamily